MAEPVDGEMSRHSFQVAYYGTDTNDHTMDAEVLGPALLAFGRLIREANSQVNGERARVKVLVTSDFEHKCFNINFEVVQNIIQTIKTFLDGDAVKNAEEILGKLGIIGGGTTMTVFGLLKFKNGRKLIDIQQTKDTDSTGDIIVNVKIEGDGNTVHVPASILKLSENKKILRNLNETLGPIEMGNANRIEFRDGGKTAAIYDREDTQAIVRSIDTGPDPIVLPNKNDPKPEIVTTTLYVYSPVFDEKAKTWRFNHDSKHIYVDISDTNIAPEAMRRGGSFTNDRYRVRMEITPPDSDGGEPHYKILEVLDFTPAPQQENLTFPRPRKRR